MNVEVLLKFLRKIKNVVNLKKVENIKNGKKK
jgi:hypothetical protein